MQDNFIGVISGNLALLCLALADEEDMEEETAYILENMIKTMEIETGLFFPDGGYYEGVAYSSYLFDYFTYGLNALFKCCGTDYSVGAAKGFAKALGESLVPVYAGKGALSGNSICTGAGAVMATILSQWLWPW